MADRLRRLIDASDGMHYPMEDLLEAIAGDLEERPVIDGGVEGQLDILPQPPRLFAHRGLGLEAPEETVPAYTSALTKQGIYGIEGDVHMTSDGVPVLMHDSTVDRTTNGTGAVSSLTYAQFRALDAGVKFSPEFAGTPPADLDEICQLARSRSKALAIEIKSYRTGKQAEDIATIVNKIIGYGLEEVTYLAAFSLSDLTVVRSITKKMALMWGHNGSSFAQYLALGGRLCLNSPGSTWLANPNRAAEVRALGMIPVLYTIDSAADYRRGQEVGVDMVFTDRAIFG